ncbi:hypothetical protein SAMN05421819_4394 [Bryocella elongata]|uniref:Uncharacterized protein n=1 Tax=Bryocella elongata TaxID=863522 RepID=A0A1H6CAE4_9BACT|nr:hypothetical protein [Bryocella elongata]SEG69940.1 hypothetical protein SAMN05421819_4394 [Bryocella elongata]
MDTVATADERKGSRAENAADRRERRALIERVAGSALFRRSARLRDFLLYVGLRSVDDDSAEIHEQEIGERVFDRSREYDRSQDNIVRVNATELRRRVDQYFATEGEHEPLTFSIPRGSYKPVFHVRSETEARPLPSVPDSSLAPAAAVSGLAAQPVVGDTAPRVPMRVHAMWAIASVAIAALSVVSFGWWQAGHRPADAAHAGPAVSAFWSRFASTAHPADIVLPDDSLSVAEDVLKRPVMLTDYLDRSYQGVINTSSLSDDRKADLWQILNHNLITLGAFHGAQQISSLPGFAGAFRLTAARFYGADSIKRNNVVLMGGKKANPWVVLMERDMNFILDFDFEHGQAFVQDRHPAPGAPARYAVTNDPIGIRGYSIVAYLPNPSRTGQVVIAEGTDSDGTSAAAEFLTSEEQIQHLKAALHTDRLPYFEALLRTTRLSGTSLNAEIIAVHRVQESAQ